MEDWPFPRLADVSWLAGDGKDDALTAVRTTLRTTLSDRGVVTDGSVESVLSGLEALADLSERLQWAMLALTGEARAAGATWTQVGDALGVSKQAAQQRFAPYLRRALAEAAAADDC